MKFRKNPVEIEAMQFTGDNLAEIRAFVGTLDGYSHGFHLYPGGANVDGNVAEVWDKLHSSWVGVKKGQWIIRGLKGEFYPCDDEVFRDSYSEVEEVPTVAYQDLPVFMPGNNRNWHRVDAKLTVTEDGRIEMQLLRDELHEELLRQWREGILMQVSFDYRTPPDDLEKINLHFAKDIPADDMEVGAILSDAGVRHIGDVLRLFKLNGIKFMKEK